MTGARTLAGAGVGVALMTALVGCSPGAADGSLSGSAPISAAAISDVPVTTSGGSNPKRTAAAPADSIFAGPTPVSVASWWAGHPRSAPPDLAGYRLLFDQPGSGPRRFRGPDLRRYDRVLMVITCSGTVEYSLRLQVLDGLSIATTAGDSCGGPTLSSYVSPPLTVTDPKTEVEVEVPAAARYHVTIYGTAAG